MGEVSNREGVEGGGGNTGHVLITLNMNNIINKQMYTREKKTQDKIGQMSKLDVKEDIRQGMTAPKQSTCTDENRQDPTATVRPASRQRERRKRPSSGALWTSQPLWEAGTRAPLQPERRHTKYECRCVWFYLLIDCVWLSVL